MARRIVFTVMQLTYTLLFLIVIVMGGCSSDDTTGKVTGKVLMVNDTGNPASDPVDYSGIRVSLYKTVVVDTTIVRVNNEFSGLGPSIGQSTEFDHRLHEPVYTVLTLPDGSYELKDVKSGVYNFVFEKQGWGYQYLCDVNTRKGEYIKSTATLEHVSNVADMGKFDFNIEDVTLYPDVTLPSVTNESFNFQARHHYYVESDAVFMGTCVFEGGSYIHLNAGKKIQFLSAVITYPGSDVSKFNATQVFKDRQRIQNWDSIIVHENETTIQNWSLANANTGIVFYGIGCKFRDSIISNSTNGIYCQGKSMEIKRILFHDLSDRAIVLNQLAGATTIQYDVSESFFLRCFIGIRTQGQGVSLTNNYFISCDSGIISFTGYQVIENNNFDINNNAIVCVGTYNEIKKNIFYNNTNSIFFSRAYYSNDSNPVILNNDFYQTTGYAIKLDGWTTYHDIDAGTITGKVAISMPLF